MATPPRIVGVGASASSSEKNASSSTSAGALSSIPKPVPKLRSCVVCRSRKVRCDKQSPCSNCRRGNIACVFPSTNRPPRWARGRERLTNNPVVSATSSPQDAGPGVDKVMERLRNLENLVKELSGQLEQAHAAASLADGSLSKGNSPESPAQNQDTEHQGGATPATNTNSVQKQFGRLVLQDASRSRYISSGFWSRVNDEVSRPLMATPSS